MIKFKFILILIIIIFYSNSYSQTYFGIGADYLIPYNTFNHTNQQSYGINIQIESRRTCNLWYGIRVDYIPISLRDTLTQQQNYFQKWFSISPEFRWNFCNYEFNPLGKSIYDGTFNPYIQGLINLSTISNTDGATPLGLGFGIGGGCTANTKFWNKCFMFDLNLLYVTPNSIYRDDSRTYIQSILLSLTVSMRI